MAVKADKVTVTTTPISLETSDTDGIAGYSVTFTVPTDGQTVYLGGSQVTPAQGFPISPGATINLELDTAEKVWAVVASGNQPINCLWRGV